MPRKQRREYWSTVGGYVLKNAWQPVFMLDVRRNFRRGIPAGGGRYPMLERFDRSKDLQESRICRLVATVVVRTWFRLMCLYTRSREQQDTAEV
jgi:hypothetical protein